MIYAILAYLCVATLVAGSYLCMDAEDSGAVTLRDVLVSALCGINWPAVLAILLVDVTPAHRVVLWRRK